MADSKTTLIVKNIAPSCSKETFQKQMETYGPVKSCFLVPCQSDQKSQSLYGFVSFALKSDAEQAIKSPSKLQGRTISVAFARRRLRPQDESVDEESVNKSEPPHSSTAPATPPDAEKSFINSSDIIQSGEVSKSSDAKKTTKVSKSPDAIQSGKVSELSNATQSTKAPKSPNATQSTKVSKSPNSIQSGKVPTRVPKEMIHLRSLLVFDVDEEKLQLIKKMVGEESVIQHPMTVPCYAPGMEEVVQDGTAGMFLAYLIILKRWCNLHPITC